VATPENEAKLLEMALIATGAQLERLCRGYRGVLDGESTPAAEQRSLSKRLLPGGMVKLELVLQPDEADLVLRAIERAQQVRAREVRARQAPPLEPEAETAGVSAETAWPSRADGAVTIAESFLAGNPVTGTGGERFQVMVHLDQATLGPDGVLAERTPPYSACAATLEDGTRVSAETLRRVACDWRPHRHRSRWGGAEHRPPRTQHSPHSPPRADAA